MAPAPLTPYASGRSAFRELMMLENPVVDVLGWLGAGCVLVAYGLVSAGRVHGRSRSYQIPNAIGSVLLTVNTYFYHAYPSSFVNVLWLGIAVYALRAKAHPPRTPA